MAEVKKKSLKINVKNIKEFNLPYWEIDSGKEGPCFFLTAALHGCEVIGCEVMRRFCPVAAEKLVKGRILLLPFSNPPALWNRRHNLYSSPNQPKGMGIDNINGAWPGNPGGHEIEQLAYIINENLIKQSTHNIDMHCWSRFTVAASLPDDDEKQIAFARAAALPALYILKTVKKPETPPTRFTLSGLFNSTGRLAFSMEFSGQYLLSEREIKLGLRMLSNCSKYMKIFDGELEGMDEPVMLFDYATEKTEVRAPMNGLFVENGLQVGDAVSKGDRLGILFSDDNLETTEITAPADGFLYEYGCHRRLMDVDLADQHPYADKGDVLAIIRTGKILK
ncbi:MAG TPA: succinylglutamate desuccinylase/aspartoacylase family protein [bacterium]|nr:succinylglutamate desuccinylase/aspartoacylase family protein [bacterium]